MLLLLGTLSGCLGIGFRGTGHSGPSASELQCFDEDAANPGPVRGEDLVEHWGPADTREVTGPASERWTYERGLRWNGLILYVLVPVPLLVPVGHDRVTFDVVDGEVVTAQWRYGTGTDYLLGLVPGPCPYFGAGVLRH